MRGVASWCAGAAALAAALMPVGAQATPPDIVDIIEEPFAISDTHLIITRTSLDNLGVYESTRIETFLVAIELASRGEQVWALDRLTRTAEYSSDGHLSGYVTKRDDDGDTTPKNPYRLIASYGAVPWTAAARSYDESAGPKIYHDAAGVTVTYADGARYGASAEALEWEAQKTIAMMASEVSNTPRLSTFSTRDLFSDRANAPIACRPIKTLDYFYLGMKADYRLLKMSCGEGEDDGIVTIIARLGPLDGGNGAASE